VAARRIGGGLSVLDAHVHVWDAGALDHPWLRGADLPAVRLPPHYRHDHDHDHDPSDDRGEDADGVVVVEADAGAGLAVAEVRWIAGLDWPELRGIVAAADLRDASLGDALDALSAAGPVVGVRDLLQNEPVAQWRPGERADGLRELARRGLTFDACVRHPQLDALADLLEAAPETRVVLDHLGKPPLTDGLLSVAGQAWQRALRRVAALPHAFVKLSGLPAETGDRVLFDAHADAFLEAALDAFGPERAMFGSDWPVSTTRGVADGAAAWSARVRRISGDGWAAVSHRTGAQFYGLGEAGIPPCGAPPTATPAPPRAR